MPRNRHHSSRRFMARDLDHIRETKPVIFENPESQSKIRCNITNSLGVPNESDCNYFCLYTEGQEKNLTKDGICSSECAFKIFRRKEGY